MPHDTRERIVAAAYQVLVERGYEATSVKDIGAAAGVAPGLVHYYFGSKEELLLAAVRFGCEEAQKHPDLGPEQEARLAFASAKAGIPRNAGFHRLFFDMCGVAMHNPHVAEVLRRFIAEERGGVERIAREVLAVREREAVGAPAIAGAIWGGVIGIILQGLLDPGFDRDPALDALARMALEGA